MNLVAPDLEAVNMLPVPDWSTMRFANDVAPEMDAAGAPTDVAWTSSVASGAEVPTPNRLAPLSK